MFNVFDQVHCEGDACSVAHFSFTFLYPLPDDRMIDSIHVVENNNKRNYNVRVLCFCVDWVANVQVTMGWFCPNYVMRLSINSQHFMELGTSLPCSQEPIVCTCPKPDGPRPHPPRLSIPLPPNVTFFCESRVLLLWAGLYNCLWTLQPITLIEQVRNAIVLGYCAM